MKYPSFIPKHKLVIIEWLDSCGPAGWHSPCHDSCNARCVSIGWITDEDKECLTLTSHIQISEDLHHADLMIPKCSIIRMSSVKVGSVVSGAKK